MRPKRRLPPLAVLLAAVLTACVPGIQPIPTPTPSPFDSGTPAPGTPAPGTSAPGTPTPGGPTSPPTADTGRLIAASVKIIALRQTAAGLRPSHSGSGTIISADGLILTNAHVAAPDAPGLAVQYGDVGGSDPVDQLQVLMTEQEDRPPVPRYTAEVLAVDGYLDIAVLQVVATADGQPLTGGLDLPWVPLGDSDALRIRDTLIVIGFPGIGGDTVSASDGDVSGFLEDDKIGPRGWIKTSAIVHSGNSGGLAANSRGELVGVPTRAPDSKDPSDIGGFELLRPISLAMPVVEAALSGEDYGVSRHVVSGTGRESLEFVGWLRDGDADCSASNLVTSYPSGATALVAGFDWSGFSDGQDIGWFWLGQSAAAQEVTVLDRGRAEWSMEASGTCLPVSISHRSEFPDGTYAVVLGAGPQLRIVGEQQVSVGGAGDEGPQDGIQLRGRVLDGQSGRGVADATVIVLEPGTDPGAWLRDANRDNALAVAGATTESDGTYTLDRRLATSTEYSLVIAARGYEPWLGTLTTGTQDGAIDDLILDPVAP